MQLTKVCVFLLLFLASFDLCASVKVIKHPDPGESLAARWKWAINKAQGEEFENGFWIAYMIKRLMPANVTMGHFDDNRVAPTLMEVISGIRPTTQKTTIREEAESILNQLEVPSDKMIWKEIAVLIQFQQPSRNISRINFSNVELTFSLKNLPVFWLGNAENQQSIEMLKTLYQNTSVSKRREELIGAIGIHQSPDLVIPFLKGIVAGREDAAVRKSAIFWLGQTQEPAALKFLLNVASTIEHTELGKSAVFSISQMKFPEANQALIELANQKDNRVARLEAIFWIGQQGFDEAPKILEQIVFHDGDQEAQEKAVFSCSQLKRELGIPVLIRIARNHKESRIREEAIFWIGQIGSEAEGEMLEKVVHHDPDRSTRKKAIFSISQMKKEISISRLERIAKTHPETEMRKEAIFWLGQMKDPRAKNVLLQFLKK
ncbi:HEAT repeat domain-containing protein [bacterium]|nr:HEAT repeat domain-containing protein [bacterium]MCI0606590.1 HEAT repeat domain-containing protein [bacterium]